MKFELYLTLDGDLKNAELTSDFECENSKQAFDIAEDFIYDAFMSSYEDETAGKEFDEFDFLVYMEDEETDYYLKSGNLIFKNFKSEEDGNPLRKLLFRTS